MLKITGKTLSQRPALKDESKEDQPIEFVTEGKLYSRGSTTYISYEETPLSGMEGCTTSLTITPERVRLKRSGAGAGDTVMIFEKGTRMMVKYYTPYGPLDMEILTNKISPLTEPPIPGEAPEKSGRLSIDYSLSLKGLLETRKLLDIEIMATKDHNDPEGQVSPEITQGELQ